MHTNEKNIFFLIGTYGLWATTCLPTHIFFETFLNRYNISQSFIIGTPQRYLHQLDYLY